MIATANDCKLAMQTKACIAYLKPMHLLAPRHASFDQSTRECARVHIHNTRMHGRTHVHTHTRTHTYTHINTHARTHTYTPTCARAHACTHIHTKCTHTRWSELKHWRMCAHALITQLAPISALRLHKRSASEPVVFSKQHTSKKATLIHALPPQEVQSGALDKSGNSPIGYAWLLLQSLSLAINEL